MSYQNDNDTDNYSDNKQVKIDLVNKELAATQAKMQDNIGKLLERGQKIEDIETKAEQLSDSAVMFRHRSKKLKCHFIYQYWKLIIAILLVVILLIVILYFALRKKD